MKYCLLLLLVFAGCSTVHRVLSPTLTIDPATLGSQPKTTITGDAQVPAKVDTTNSVTKLPLPANTKMVFDAGLGTYTLVFALPTELSTTATKTAIIGPTAFQPPAPPTPSDVADGKMSMVYGVGALVGGALAIFGLVRCWNLVMYGGMAIFGACMLGKFVYSNPILTISLTAVGCVIAFFGPYIWHNYAKHLNPEPTKL